MNVYVQCMYDREAIPEFLLTANKIWNPNEKKKKSRSTIEMLPKKGNERSWCHYDLQKAGGL